MYTDIYGLVLSQWVILLLFLSSLASKVLALDPDPLVLNPDPSTY